MWYEIHKLRHRCTMAIILISQLIHSLFKPSYQSYGISFSIVILLNHVGQEMLIISGTHFSHFSPFIFFFHKMAILDDRKSLSIAFLAISDQYSTFLFGFFFHKMAAGGHFGYIWPKITFDRISRHFQINTQLLFWWGFCSQNGCQRPFWMTKNPFRSHFWSMRNFVFF